MILLGAFRIPPMPFPMPPLFITAAKDICAINTFRNILFYFINILALQILFFSANTTDMSLYEVLKLFPR